MSQTDSKEIKSPLELQIQQDLERMMGMKPITSNNISTVLLSLMQTVEDYNDVKGTDKRSLVLHALDLYIDDQTDNKGEIIELKNMINNTLPSVVDMIVGMSNGDVRLKLAQKTCSAFLACLSDCSKSEK